MRSRNTFYEISLLCTSEVFMTTVHPVASAGPSFHACIKSGKFQGMICPTTPIGSCKVMSHTHTKKNFEENHFTVQKQSFSCLTSEITIFLPFQLLSNFNCPLISTNQAALKILGGGKIIQHPR